MKTDTPRTDAAEYHLGFDNVERLNGVVDSGFARQLETELNEAKAEVERLKAKVNAEINENLQHLADLRGYEEFEMPAKNQLIEKLAAPTMLEALEKLYKSVQKLENRWQCEQEMQAAYRVILAAKGEAC